MEDFRGRPSRKGVYVQLLGERVELLGERGTKVGRRGGGGDLFIPAQTKPGGRQARAHVCVCGRVWGGWVGVWGGLGS